MESLRGLETETWDYPPELVAERFKAHPELMPHTLSDCLHELAYWDDLYRLRRACSKDYDTHQEVWSRDQFIFTVMLAELRPRNRDEARATLRHLLDSERRDWKEVDRILDNLIG